MNKFYDIGIAGQIGRYSDAAETSLGARIFVTSGTPGLTPEGRVPEGIAAPQNFPQARRVAHKQGKLGLQWCSR